MPSRPFPDWGGGEGCAGGGDACGALWRADPPDAVKEGARDEKQPEFKRNGGGGRGHRGMCLRRVDLRPGHAGGPG